MDNREWYAEWDEVDGERFFVVEATDPSGGYGVAWIPEDEVPELLTKAQTDPPQEDTP